MARKSKKSEEKPIVQRPPIVAVMGHVDHGKTSLLDAIRQTNVASREHGGITQGVGASQIEFQGKKITFIDTPGHAAFAKMRSRGASATDIVVLVVAANDGVMPQTIESIKHIQEAKVPVIVAINKIDLPDAMPEKVKKQLSKEGILVEGMGGDVVVVEVSAKTKKGIDTLLEMILLMSQMQEIKGDPKDPFEGVVIESSVDKGRGPIASIIVKKGTLKVGDEIFAETIKCRVKAMFNGKGIGVKEALPSDPVLVMGFEKVPEVGTKVTTLKINLSEPAELPTGLPPQEDGRKLKVILKADVKGSLEAITYSFPDGLRVLSTGLGDVSESDVLLAKSSKGIVVGFNVKVSHQAQKLAETEKVLVKTYNIIYELLDEIGDVMEALNKPIETEKILGTADVIASFDGGEGKIAGCKIKSGRFVRGDRVRIERSKENIGLSKIKHIKHLKEDIDKALIGTECGLFLDPQLDFAPGDAIIALA